MKPADLLLTAEDLIAGRKRKEPELDPKEQFKRFQQAAEQNGVAAKEAEKLFKRLALKKQKK